MQAFNPRDYGKIVYELLSRCRANDLGPGHPNESARQTLEALTPETICPGKRLVDRDMAAACLSGLWLRHDFLDASHAVSQQVKTPSGSFWHGIMHRREGDFANAKYWFRQTGPHPVFETLREDAAKLARETVGTQGITAMIESPAWDAFAFVDLCAEAHAERSADEAWCRRVQQCEWQRLFDFCFCHAFA